MTLRSKQAKSLGRIRRIVPEGSRYLVAEGDFSGPHDDHMPAWYRPVVGVDGIWTPFGMTGDGLLWRICVYPVRSPTPVEELAEVGHVEAKEWARSEE